MKKELEPWELEESALVDLLSVDSPDFEQTAEDVEEGSRLVWNQIGLLERSRELLILAESFMAPACSVLRHFCEALTPDSNDETDNETLHSEEESNP